MKRNNGRYTNYSDYTKIANDLREAVKSSNAEGIYLLKKIDVYIVSLFHDMNHQPYITSSETLISTIRRMGIVPLFKGNIPGWSIEEMTDPDYWFTSSDELGPWDWKIDVLMEGDILYGKFIKRKATFATVEYYRHLMNWRRSLPRYRMALGEEYQAVTIDDKMMQRLSPILLSAIREYGSLESCDIRKILAERVPETDRKKIGGHVVKYLVPTVKRQAVSFLTQYLEMGTWTVIGNIERVYRGPNLEYRGWQRATITTPEEETNDNGISFQVSTSPEESRLILAKQIATFAKDVSEETIMKLL